MLTDFLFRHAVIEPDLPAVAWSGGSMSYGDLGQAVRYTADGLKRDGLAHADTVGVVIADEIDHFVVTLALMSMGCIHIVLPTYEGETFRANLARRVGCVAVVGDGSVRSGDVPVVLPSFGRAASVGEPAVTRPGDMAMYAASSGTTGRPKIVPQTHGQLLGQARRWQWHMRREVYCRASSIEFNPAHKQRLHALEQGSTNVFLQADDVVETCRRHGVTRLAVSLAQARSIEERARRGDRLPAECRIRIGGSTIPPEFRRAFVANVTQEVEINYGTSEAGAIATAGPALWEHVPDAVGFVHPGLSVQIVDDDDRPLEPGRTGRLRISGEGVADRYFDDATATEGSFRDGWFRPGDMGRFTGDGVLTLEGRADEMMSLASINIFPAEIEAVVSTHPDVLACAAFSMHKRSLGDVPLVAVVAGRPGAEADIRDFARERLGVRAPRQVYAVDSLPYSTAGKIDRNALRERLTPKGDDTT